MNASLWELGEGQTAVLSGFAPAMAPTYLLRLKDLGFQPGEAVTCVNAPRFGAPRVYRISNSFFSLERAIAHQMLVGAAGSGATGSGATGSGADVAVTNGAGSA